MSVDTCVCCGAPVPEGTWVCPTCIKKVGVDAEMSRSPDGVYTLKINGKIVVKGSICDVLDAMKKKLR